MATTQKICMKTVYRNQVQGRFIDSIVPVWVSAMGLEWLYKSVVKSKLVKSK